MRLAVYTATFGETHPVLVPAFVEPSVRYLCFTDGRQSAPAPYENVLAPTWDHPPHLAARRIKVLAEPLVLRSYDALLWHDSSYRLSRSPSWAVRALADGDLAAMRHARRDRLEDEAMSIARYRYVTSTEADAHVARYRAEGFDVPGLSSSGLLALRRSPAVSAFRRIWWEELLKWGGRDQGSLDYAAWKAGLRIHYVKGNHRSNPYAAWRPEATA